MDEGFHPSAAPGETVHFCEDLAVARRYADELTRQGLAVIATLAGPPAYKFLYRPATSTSQLGGIPMLGDTTIIYRVRDGQPPPQWEVVYRHSDEDPWARYNKALADTREELVVTYTEARYSFGAGALLRPTLV